VSRERFSLNDPLLGDKEVKVSGLAIVFLFRRQAGIAHLYRKCNAVYTLGSWQRAVGVLSILSNIFFSRSVDVERMLEGL